MRSIRSGCVLLCVLGACIDAKERGPDSALDGGNDALIDGGFDAGRLKPALGELAEGTSCGRGADFAGQGGGAAPGTLGAWGEDGGGGGDVSPLEGAHADAAIGPSVPAPAAHGELVITELLADPKTLDDSSGEWFELHNPTQTQLDLAGCSVLDRSGTPHVIEAHALIDPGAYATVARSSAAGFTPDVVVSFSLTNSAGQLALVCQGTEIDRVVFDKAAKFPLAPGASASLDPAQLDATANDVPSAWCLGVASYGPELGTPGAANPSCSVPDASVP